MKYLLLPLLLLGFFQTLSFGANPTGAALDSIPITLDSVHAVNCHGDSTGAIFISVPDLIISPNGYTFKWSNGDSTEDVTDLPAGIYSVTVADTLGNVDSLVGIVVPAVDPLKAVFSVQRYPFCNDSLGILSVAFSGGTPPYIWKWSTGDTTLTVDSLAAGTYSVTVSDANACSLVASFDLQPQVPVIDIQTNSPNVTCAFPVVTLDASGSQVANGFIFQWTASGGGAFSSPTDSLVVQTNVQGTYSLTIKDTVNACFATDSITIGLDTIHPVAVAGADSLVACTNTVLNLDGAGSSTGDTISYEWTVLPPSGGQGGGGHIAAGGDSLSPTVDHAGAFILTVTDVDNGCFDTDTVVVTGENVPPAVLLSDDESLTCTVTEIALSAQVDTANTVFQWTGPGGFNAVVLDTFATLPGTYHFIVTDTLTTCTTDSTVVVSIDTVPPTIELSVNDTITCGDTSAIINATLAPDGGLLLTWSGPGNFAAFEDSVEVHSGGEYFLLAIDITNGCLALDSITVPSDTTAPAVSIAVSNVITCIFPTATLTATVSANTTFSWTGPGGFVSGEQNVEVEIGGEYALTVTDTLNGCVASDTATVLENTAVPTVELVLGAPITCLVPTTTITAIVTPNDNVTFSWTGPGGFVSTDQNITVDLPGEYVLTVTNTVNGCTASASAIVVAILDLPTVEIESSGTLACDNPTVTLTAIASPLLVNFSWTGPGGFTSTDASVTVDVAGEYVVVVTNPLNGCTASASANVTGSVNPPVAEAGTGGTITCFVETLQLDGAGSSTGTGIAYFWTTLDGNVVSGETTLTPTVNAGGTYVLLVTDISSGCTATDSVSVDEDTTPPAVDAAGGQVTCFEPELQLLGFFDTTGVEWEWTLNGVFVSDEQNPVVTEGGVYQLTVTDTVNGCSSIAFAVVLDENNPPQLDIDLVAGGLNCVADTATLEASSTNFGVNFNWAGPGGFASTEATVQVTEPGLYEVLALDTIFGCIALDSFLLDFDTLAPVADAGDPVSFNCATVSDTLDGTGSSQGNNFSYLWSTQDGVILSGANTLTPVVGATGTYVLLVTDLENGCSATDTVQVFQIPDLELSVAVTSPTCFGEASGSVTVTPAGGVAPFVFLWSTGANTATVGNLVAGTYVVTATDANGCSSVDTIFIDEPDPLSPNATATAQSAAGVNDGTATANPTGGTPTYTYLWSNGETTQQIQNLAPGAYVVSVTDANNCTAVQTVNVNVEGCALVGSVSTTPVACNGTASGTATANVDNEVGAVQFAWSTGATTATATGLAAGQYNVTVSDSLGCQLVLTATLSEPAPLIIGELFHEDVNCADEPTGFSHAFVGGGVQPYHFEWTNGDTTNTADSLVAGTYTLFLTDANGCVQAFATTIEALDSMPPVLIVQNAFVVLDANGQASVTASQFDAGSTDNCSLASFTVSQTAFDCDDIGFNTVTITATDSNGNTATATATINVLDATAPVLTCPGNVTVGACNATVSYGGIGFSDNCPLDSSQLVQTAGLPSGSTFPVGVTLQVFTYEDAAGNQGTCFFTVTVVPAVSASVAATTNVLCAGDCNGTASLLVSGGQQPYSVAWSNGASDTFVDSLCAGTYSATVSDASGCSTGVEVTITQPAALGLSLTNVVSPACPDDLNGSITAEVSGGSQPYSYLWSNGSTSASIGNLGVGAYAVIVTDANDCSATQTITLAAADSTAPVLVVQNDTVSLDANGSAILTANLFVTSASDDCGNFTLAIQPSEFGCADLGDHPVTITATDESGNVGTATATVTIVDEVPPVLDCPDDIVAGDCNPNVLFVLPQVGDNCDVNPLNLLQTAGLPSGALFPEGVTLQSFSYSDAAGNVGTCSFNVTVSAIATITAVIVNPTCADECDATATLTIVGGVAPYNVSWSNGDTGLTADSLCAGTFTASVTDASLCLQIFTGTVMSPSALDFNIDQVTHETNGAANGSISISVTGGTAPYTFAWTKNGAAFSTSEDLTNLSAGTYLFVATDANGCVIASEEIVVENETGTDEPAWATGISLQPNPASDWVRLELKQPLAQEMEVRLLDATGKLARTFRLESQQASVVFDLSGMAAGVYSVQMFTADSAVVRRLVIGR